MQACLWNSRTPIRLSLKEETGGAGRVIVERVETDPTKGMMCIPIGAIFHVLNWTHVHLVSLDTETTEPHILV